MEKEPGDAGADRGYLGSAFGEVGEECGVNSAGLGIGCCVVLDLGYAGERDHSCISTSFMEKLLLNNKLYSLCRFENEAEFERVIVKNVADIFGPKRLYLDTKRRIGAKGKKNSIPDGYVFDFGRQKDLGLYIVENELAAHDPFTNIGP